MEMTEAELANPSEDRIPGAKFAYGHIERMTDAQRAAVFSELMRLWCFFCGSGKGSCRCDEKDG